MRTFLGVDGGGSKTRFLLIDERGTTLAVHDEGSAYHLETGISALGSMLSRGVAMVLALGQMDAADLTYAFFGLPAYGEDRSLQHQLDTAPAAALPSGRFRCGNDMICGWAGALAGEYGINIVAGTGSIAYGEYAGQSARAGGWGELFSDEGSAFWLAREGLRLFSRMSDGRTPRGALYGKVRSHFGITEDLELCAAVYGKEVAQRSQFAQLSKLVAQAAQEGDLEARALFHQGAGELVDIVDAVRVRLGVPSTVELPVSCTGGMFELRELMLAPFESALSLRPARYRLVPPRLSPEAGAALYAARLSGAPLEERSINVLAAASGARP